MYLSTSRSYSGRFRIAAEPAHWRDVDVSLDIPHTATAFDKGKVGNWDTGPLDKGETKAITFSEPGTYFYICTPHPWMYGQVIVE